MKATCKHPIEWDKRLFNCEKIEKDYREITNAVLNESIKNKLIKESEKSDIWEKGLSKVFKKNNFYFVNPIYFLNHLENAGLLEFNPYEGKKYEYGWGYYCVDGTSKSQTQNVNSNPGFAPLSINGEGVKAFDKLFANPNGLFRETYPGENGSYGHEGLDFDGAIGTEIYSFIYGIVEKIPKSQGALHYGMNLVIKSPNGYLYLLGHLSEICVQEKEQIYPGKLVAKVGNTGNCKSSGGGDGSHLHLSVYKADGWEDIVTGYKKKDGMETYENYVKDKKLLNPFDFGHTYKD